MNPTEYNLNKNQLEVTNHNNFVIFFFKSYFFTGLQHIPVENREQFKHIYPNRARYNLTQGLLAIETTFYDRQ